VEHRQKKHGGFGEEAAGLADSQVQHKVAEAEKRHVAPSVGHVEPVRLAPETPASSAHLRLQQEAYTTDPTAGVVAPNNRGGGVAGFFSGFFCNACEATERQDEYNVSSVAADGVAVRVS